MDYSFNILPDPAATDPSRKVITLNGEVVACASGMQNANLTAQTIEFQLWDGPENSDCDGDY